MGSPSTFIVSDLHLGNDHFHHDEFLSWLDGVPDGATLVLNGDIIDDPHKPLLPAHSEVLQRLVAESFKRSLIWVYGNHDAGIQLEDPGRIQFGDYWEFGRRLLIVHGDDFDSIMPKHGLFRLLFKILHRMRVCLGFRRVHVAEYAKKWAFLYRVLSEHVAKNALEAARTRGFEAVTCGHTHGVMDVARDGVRYLNTGAWTERPLTYIDMRATDLSLRSHGDNH